MTMTETVAEIRRVVDEEEFQPAVRMALEGLAVQTGEISTQLGALQKDMDDVKAMLKLLVGRESQ